MISGDIRYSILDLQAPPLISAGDAMFDGLQAGELPSFQNSFSGGVDPGAIGSGDLTANLQQQTGVLYSGKTAFDNTETGYRLGLDGTTAKFYIGDSSSYLNWTGTALNIAGTLTAGQLHIPDQDTTANSFHVQSDGDTWWGATETNFNADNDNANAYVLKTGVAKFQNVTLSGSVVIGALSSGSLPSIQGWQYDGAFSSTDFDTVAWATGTLTFSNGETRSITGANTGNMVARTYIYYDEDVSTTAFQTTTTASSAVGGNKILIAIAENTTSGKDAEYQVFGGVGGFNKLLTNSSITANTITASEIAANTITANEIAANTITASEIAAGTITATEMNVSQLSAISADLGAITAGTIVLPSGGLIRSGQTAYDSGTGFYIGNDSGTPKFSIGNSAGNKLTWDGSTLTVEGTVGGTLDAADLSGNIAASAHGAFTNNWTFSGTWTLTDANTVTWGAGTLTLSNGNTYSIGTGNTGNMTAKTFIYLDLDVSTTAFQTTTTRATAVGENKLLIAIAEDGTDEPTLVVLNDDRFNIDAANIVAGSITANEIAASTITATEMNVSQLSGISADLGTITAGTVTGATLRTASSGTRFEMTSSAFQGLNSGGTTIFEVLLSGNAGDVIMGDDASGNYAHWDNSASTFTVYKGGNSIVKFGGDGSDGALSISSGTTTIDCSNAQVVEKNYTSISITGTGKLAFSNPHANGTVIILKSQGNVVLTSSTSPCIDASSMGATAGAEQTANADGNDGTTGTSWAVFSNSGLGGSSSSNGGGGASAPSAVEYVANITGVAWRWSCGAGGGSGGGNNQSPGGGAGGRGGGAVLIECAGDLNFTGTVSCAGANGSDGGDGGVGEPGMGGGGGGAAGSFVILYNSLTSAAGTVTRTGGTGGAGGDADSNPGSTGGSGGGSGGGNLAAGGGGGNGGADGVNGSSGGSGSGTTGGSGGSGGTGASGGGGGGGGGGGAGGHALVALNTEFS